MLVQVVIRSKGISEVQPREHMSQSGMSTYSVSCVPCTRAEDVPEHGLMFWRVPGTCIMMLAHILQTSLPTPSRPTETGTAAFGKRRRQQR